MAEAAGTVGMLAHPSSQIHSLCSAHEQGPVARDGALFMRGGGGI
jgi:hypothetical protein